MSNLETKWVFPELTTRYIDMMTSSNGKIFRITGPHKGQWRGALMFSLICARINDWVNNPEAGDLRRYRGHYDVNVMSIADGPFW